MEWPSLAKRLRQPVAVNLIIDQRKEKYRVIITSASEESVIRKVSSARAIRKLDKQLLTTALCHNEQKQA